MEFLKAGILRSKYLSHGFFGREGGVSTDIYSSLNCGLGTKDDRENILENRTRVAAAISGNPQNLVTLHQEHTPLCVYVDTPWPAGQGPKADGMVTDKPDIVLGILTADCAPVLFHGIRDDGSALIGAAHAGWRGAVGGILENTVDLMRQKGAIKIQAAIGPCIGQKSYEVSPGFEAPFLAQNPGNEKFFRKNHFDLPAYILSRLKKAGVKAKWCGVDTYKAERKFFSYRRTTHRGEADYGRQLSVIIIHNY